MANELPVLSDDTYDEAMRNIPRGPQIIATMPPTNNPDKAAEAVKLGDATGVPAEAIHQDVDKFRQQTQAQAGAAIVSGNPYLDAYISAHPMHGKVSSDDLAVMDAFSGKAQEYPKKTPWDYITGAVQFVKDYETNLFKGAAEAINVPKQTQELERLNKLFPGVFNRYITNPAIMAAYNAGIVLPTAAFSGLEKAWAPVLGEKHAAEVNEAAQLAMMVMGGHMQVPPEFNAAAAAAKKLEPYARELKPPPRGLDPTIDKWMKEQGAEDIEKLTETFKAATASATRERMPAYFQDFAERHFGEETVGISHETVEALYGDKVPARDDGLLGFIPDIEHQMEVARDTGGDVQVRVADMLAHMDPEVYESVKDGIRTRPEGFTAVEEPKPGMQEATTPEGVNYPDPYVGRVHLGYYNARDAEFMKDNGAAGPHDVPDWLRPAQAIVDQLSKDLGLQVTPKLWAAKHSSPYKKGYADPDGHIVLNDTMDPHYAVATVLHELGHQVQNQRFNNLLDVDKQKLYRAWQEHQTPAALRGKTEQDLRPISSQGDITFVEHMDQGRRSYVLSFEEWFAEQVQRWVTKTEEPRGFVDSFFKGIADAWRKIYEKLTGHVDVAPAMDEFLRGIWQGTEIKGGGIRPPEPPVQGPVAPITPPPAPRIGLRIFDEPGAIGMTKDHWRRYERMVEKQHEEDYQANLKRAVKDETRRQSLEWKQKRTAMMYKVIDDFATIPRFIADRALREGETPKIGAQYLTDEQKAQLPRSYYSKNGVHPDKLAAYFGYDTTEAMIGDLADLHKNRGKTPPGDYVLKLVEQETDRRMEAEHGNLEDNILAVAKERTLRGSALDTLHAEIEAMAAEHGQALPYTKDSLLAHVKEKLDGMRLPLIDSDRFIGNLTKLGRMIEDGLLKGDPATAFKHRQMQYINKVYAAEALAIEKIQKSFDKTMKKFRDREVDGVRQEYTDQIHLIMDRLGLPVKRDLADIQANMDKGGFGGLVQFAMQKAQEGLPLPVPDFLTDPGWRKSMKQITGGEFKEIADLIKVMHKHGRDAMKVMKEGEKVEHAIVWDQMVKQLEDLKDSPNKYTGHDTAQEHTGKSWLKSFGWSAINIETICKRLDRGDPNGPFTQFIARPAIRAMNYRDRLIKETAVQLAAIGDFKDLHRKVENTLFKRPDGEPGFIEMTRNNVIAVLGHMGNKDNFARLCEGYKVDPDMVKDWVRRNTTKEDWEKMQKIGDIFNRLFDMADNMSYELNEIGIKRLELGAVDDPHGAGVSGWYNPVAYDRKAVKQPKTGEAPMPLEITPTGQNGFERFYATTNQAYTKERTKYRGAVLLDTAMVPIRMQQMIHDITMRPAIVELNKFVQDPRFTAKIRNWYSDTAADMFKKWVEDLAGASDVDGPTVSKANALWDAFLRNTAAAQIGFNISTVLKHGTTALSNSILQVGPTFLKAMAQAGMEGPVKGQTWAQYAMERSDELARRSRLNPESLSPQVGLKFPGADATAWGKAKEAGRIAREYGTMPVALSDLASAVPTWIAEYQKWRGKVSEGEAIDRADAAVREAHGSSAITNKPEVMRNKNPFAKAVTQFYGFFNEMLQKNYEMAWRAHDAWGYAMDGDVQRAGKDISRAANIMTRMVVAGLVEEIVTGGGDPKEGWMSKTVKGTLHAFGGTLPVVRDLVQAIMSGHDPQGSLFAAGIKSYTDLARDLEGKKAWTKPWAAKFTRDVAMAASTLSGVPVNHPVRAGEFLYNYFNHREHPQGVMQFLRGVSRGTTPKEHH